MDEVNRSQRGKGEGRGVVEFANAPSSYVLVPASPTEGRKGLRIVSMASEGPEMDRRATAWPDEEQIGAIRVSAQTLREEAREEKERKECGFKLNEVDLDRDPTRTSFIKLKTHHRLSLSLSLFTRLFSLCPEPKP